MISASTNLTQWVPVFTNPSGFGSFTFTDAIANIFSASVLPGDDALTLTPEASTEFLWIDKL